MKSKCAVLAIMLICHLASYPQSDLSTEVKTSKRHATKYFHKNKKQIPPEVLLVMNHLCVHYKQKPPVKAKNIYKRQTKSRSSYSNLFLRFIDSEYCLNDSSLSLVRNETDKLTLSSLYCNCSASVNLNWKERSLQFLNTNNIYRFTHALLALHLIKENDCFKQDSTDFENLVMLSAKRIEILKNEISKESNDKLFELYGFMKLVNEDYELPTYFIAELIKSQQKDGGWKTNTQSQQTSPHTTMLAYLILMQFR